MEWYVVLIVGLTLLLGLFLSGAPIFIAFMIINVVGTLVYFGPAGFGMFANSLYDTTTFPTLIAVPLFILMGEFLFRSGAMDVLYNSLDKLVGRSRLRLYYLSIALSTMFGALSGAAMGVVAMLGRSLFPGLIARGYDRGISTGTILAGASLAPIIPPSILVIIIGSLAQVSIARLLIAGIVPGLILAALFLAYIVIRVKIDPSRAPAVADDIGEVTWGDRGIAVLKMIPFTIIILGVLGTIMAGIATPEESAGTGVLGTLIVARIYGRLNFGLIKEACDSTARITAMILAIMMSSKMFGQLLAFSGSTTALVGFISDIEVNRWFLLFILMAVPFLLCLFIDQVALMLVVIPIYMPLLQPLGFDPIWFWLLFLINITLGGITPPFGYTMFAFKGVQPTVPMTDIYNASWPFVFIFLIGMLIFAAFPGVVTWLPNLL